MITELSDKKLHKINRIDDAVQEYFLANPAIIEVAAKELMPLFIEKGIFLKDNQKGLYIRHLLGQMQRANKLHLLKNVKAVRYPRDLNWYFTRNIDVAN